jgi:hypothetical protein
VKDLGIAISNSEPVCGVETALSEVGFEWGYREASLHEFSSTCKSHVGICGRLESGQSRYPASISVKSKPKSASASSGMLSLPLFNGGYRTSEASRVRDGSVGCISAGAQSSCWTFDEVVLGVGYKHSVILVVHLEHLGLLLSHRSFAFAQDRQDRARTAIPGGRDRQ